MVNKKGNGIDMKCRATDFYISNIRFSVSINENYYDSVCQYIHKSIGSELLCNNVFEKKIFYLVSNFEYNTACKMIDNCNLYEKVEYFKNSYCYQFYFQEQIWIKEENADWIIKIDDKKMCIYVSETNDMYNIYLLRILRSIAYGINEDKGMILLHAAAVQYDEKGIVIIGEKGSGKTTMLINFIMSNANFISNDRVFINDKMEIISFPQALRIGVGSFENAKNMKRYYQNRDFYRRQANINSTTFKYLITIDEICTIFDSMALMKGNLDWVVVPQIQIDSEECHLECITEEKKKKEIFDKICFTPIDESFRYEWIYSRKCTIENIIQKRKDIWNIFKNKKFITVRYGTLNEPAYVIGEISKFMRNIEN